MKRAFFWVLVCVSLAILVACSKKDRVIDVAEDEPEMAAAISKGRRTLPQFWQVFGRPTHGETKFALKVKITDKNGYEHFWLTNIERHDGKMFGTIDNDPDGRTVINPFSSSPVASCRGPGTPSNSTQAISRSL